MPIARSLIGLRETPGAKHNSTIIKWLATLKAWWSDDETPWCGTFVAHCIATVGMKPPVYWMRAKDWLNWGVPVLTPCVGAVVVFERKGGGHVAFVVGEDKAGNLMCLGGNQKNMVRIDPFPRSRVLGYRIPRGYQPLGALPVMVSTDPLSINEA